MKDEEMAEEYTEEKGFGSDCNNLTSYDANHEIEQAFLAGLKAGRPQWHDLREDPKDLPDNHRYVWTNVGAGYHDDDGWWDDFGRLRDVVAWCEPKFDKDY